MLFFHSLGFHSRILRIWVCMDHVDVLYVYIYFYLVHSPGINAWKEAQYICYLFSPVCFLLNILHHFNLCSFFLHIRHFELVSSLLVRGNRIGTWTLELFIFSQFEESVYQPCSPSLWNDSSHSRHYFVFLFSHHSLHCLFIHLHFFPLPFSWKAALALNSPSPLPATDHAVFPRLHYYIAIVHHPIAPWCHSRCP